MPQSYPSAISSYDQLLKLEQELLQRISEIPNGGRLYLLHPLMMFSDIGIELAPAAQDEFAARHGGAGGWSEGPYNALRRSTCEQPGKATLRSLFRRAS